MVKGTPSKGKQSGKDTHVRCRRCGKHSYHQRKSKCSSCGFGATKKLRSYSWNERKLGKRIR